MFRSRHNENGCRRNRAGSGHLPRADRYDRRQIGTVQPPGQGTIFYFTLTLSMMDDPAITGHKSHRLGACDHHLLDIGDGLGWIQTFGADIGAIHDCMTAIELERVFQLIEPRHRGVITAVDQPAIGLQ